MIERAKSLAPNSAEYLIEVGFEQGKQQSGCSIHVNIVIDYIIVASVNSSKKIHKQILNDQCRTQNVMLI